MGKISEAEREALRQASEAAIPIIRRLTQERAEIDQRIARFQAIADAYEEAIGRRPRAASGDDARKRPRRTRRGEVAGYIAAILGDGGKFTEQEIRNRIIEKFAADVPRGTVYSTLTRGRKAGKYEQTGEKWSMKD
jgi:hypothetical protein